MRVSNILVEESLHYTQDKPDFSVREDEIYALNDIAEYCRNQYVNEKISYHDDILWYIEVEYGVRLVDWLYGSRDGGGDECWRMLLEILDKSCTSYDDTVSFEHPIYISLGEFDGTAADKEEYLEKRRGYLSLCQTVEEYDRFMRSCFINSAFAKDIISEMSHIKDFSLCAEEITKCLSVLNDEAVDLYNKYHNNLKEAMNILSAKLLACSPDPGNSGKLNFVFAYEDQVNGKTVDRTKVINCSPHLKLIRRDSNLRIYFYWCDKDIDNGTKVLIGRIGRHPYR
ncbi:MAG: hypothetical protein LUG27_03660 [Clostridiales bacterium]|nr:hypothetical protein [Clostridiales bacterium]